MRAPRPIVLNQSSLKTYQNCQRLYGWNRVASLEPVGRRSAPEIGTAVHEGLAVLHAPEGRLDAALEATTAKLTERAGPGTGFEDKGLPEAKEIATKVLADYAEHWAASGQLWAPLNQEVQFGVEIQPGWAKLVYYGTAEGLREKLRSLPRTGVWFRGRLDNLSVHAAALWIIDYKTAGKMDPRDLLKYEMDMQLTGYIYAVSKQLTEDSVAASEKPGGPPAEVVRVEGAIIDLLVKTKVSQFAREKFRRSEAELEEFEREFVELGSRIREQHDRIEAGEDWKTVFPKSTEHCFRYGTCAFRDLCMKDTPIRRAAYNKREPDYVQTFQDELTLKHQKETT